MAASTETHYSNGYDRGRTICVTKGRESAQQWLKEHPLEPEPFREGVRRAIWDYEDANGYTHRDPLETA